MCSWKLNKISFASYAQLLLSFLYLDLKYSFEIEKEHFLIVRLSFGFTDYLIKNLKATISGSFQFPGPATAAKSSLLSP